VRGARGVGGAGDDVARIKADVVHRGLAAASTVEIPYRSLTFY
jgi:hypothetical protein